MGVVSPIAQGMTPVGLVQASQESEASTVPFNPYTVPLEQLREGLESGHPSAMMIYASRVAEESDQPETGLFWFYAGQLRWRTRLACHDFEPGGEGALYGAMFATLGPVFNEWAASNIDAWVATINRVNAWDLATEERFEEDKACLEQAQKQRGGMLKLKQSILNNRAKLEAATAAREAGSNDTQSPSG